MLVIGNKSRTITEPVEKSAADIKWERETPGYRVLNKAKAVPIGTKAVHGGTNVVKTAQGWRTVGKEKSDPKLEEKAAALGKKAFDEGRSSVPAQDPELRKLMQGQGNNVMPLLTAWTNAWHRANAATPVK